MNGSIKLKNKLINRETVLAGWTSIGHPQVTEMLTMSGVDFIGIDIEHSTISQEQSQRIIAACHDNGVSCMPRIATHNQEAIKRLLDSGADGIIVPTVDTPEQVDKLIEWMKYPPLGKRGYGIARAQGYGANFHEYLQWQVNEPVVIVQIEHINAIEKLEEILTESGVDGFIIGPYDLSCSMGIPGQFENDKFIEVMEHIRDTGQRLNCPAGLHIVEPDVEKLEKSVIEGYIFIAYSVDSRMLDVAAREGISKFKHIKK